MSQNVEPVRAATFTLLKPANPAGGRDPFDPRKSPGEQANPSTHHRLIIEGDPEVGYVYKSVDRLTGQVVSEYPREAVIRFQSEPTYAQGSVIDTRA